MVILGTTRAERARAAVIIAFIVLSGMFVGLVGLAEWRQRVGYEAAVLRFVPLAIDYAERNGCDLLDWGGMRHPCWGESPRMLELRKGRDEVYQLHGIVSCEWFGARLARVELALPPLFALEKCVDILPDLLRGDARAPLDYFKEVEGFRAEDLRGEIEILDDPELDRERTLRNPNQRVWQIASPPPARPLQGRVDRQLPFLAPSSRARASARLRIGHGHGQGHEGSSLACLGNSQHR